MNQSNDMNPNYLLWWIRTPPLVGHQNEDLNFLFDGSDQFDYDQLGNGVWEQSEPVI